VSAEAERTRAVVPPKPSVWLPLTEAAALHTVRRLHPHHAQTEREVFALLAGRMILLGALALLVFLLARCSC